MNFTCGICQKKYKTRRWMDAHIKNGCSPPKRKVSLCTLCNIIFESPKELQRHMELNICSQFLQNNTYCYTCHMEFGVHELLIQHEFTDEHLNVIRSEYSKVTPLSNVKNELKHIFQNGTIQEDEIFPVTIDENQIQEELFELEEALRQEETVLEKAEQKEINKKKKQKEKEKINQERTNLFNKMLEKGIKMKKKTKNKNKNNKNDDNNEKVADISSFFNFKKDQPQKNIILKDTSMKSIKKSNIVINKIDESDILDKTNMLNTESPSINDKIPSIEFKKINNTKKNIKFNKVKATKAIKIEELDKEFNYEFMGDTESEDEYTEIKMDKMLDEIITPNIKQEENKPVDASESIESIESIEVLDKPMKIKLKNNNIRTITISDVKPKKVKNTKKPKKLMIKKSNLSEVDFIIEKTDTLQQKDNVHHDVHQNTDRQIVQYNSFDRDKLRHNYYKRLRQQREDEHEIIQYNIGNVIDVENNSDGVHNTKKYIGSYNINSLTLYHKLMSNHPPNQQLPYLHTSNEADKLTTSQLQSKINNMVGARQHQEQTFQQTIPRDDKLLTSKMVSKTTRNTFGNDYSQRIKNRDQQTQNILSATPANPSAALPSMAIPLNEPEKITQDEFQKKMNAIMQSRERQDLVLKDVVDKQNVNNKPNFEQSGGLNNNIEQSGGLNNIMAAGNGSSMNIDEYQKSNQPPQRDLCSVMGMFEKQNTVTSNQPKQNIPVNHNTTQITSQFDGNQKSALDNLLGITSNVPNIPNPGKVRAPPVQTNNLNIQINSGNLDNEFDLGNELQQVSIELEKMPRPEKPKVSYEQQQQIFEEFHEKAETNFKLMNAKQLDSTVKNPVWILMQKIINEQNIDRNMMNLLVNCRNEDYVIIHQFISKSNQLIVEISKKNKLQKIFQNYTKFLGKKMKNGEYLIQGKSVKYMLDVLKKLKF
jgi:hypothetical protein